MHACCSVLHLFNSKTRFKWLPLIYLVISSAHLHFNTASSASIFKASFGWVTVTRISPPFVLKATFVASTLRGLKMLDDCHEQIVSLFMLTNSALRLLNLSQPTIPPTPAPSCAAPGVLSICTFTFGRSRDAAACCSRGTVIRRFNARGSL